MVIKHLRARSVPAALRICESQHINAVFNSPITDKYDLRQQRGYSSWYGAYITYPTDLEHIQVAKLGAVMQLFFVQWNKPQSRAYAQPDEVQIAWLCVHPEFRGDNTLQLAHRLVQKAIEVADKHGKKKLTLSVMGNRANKRAVKFYLRQGFKFENNNGNKMTMLL